MTPRQSIEAECARRGKDAVVGGCIALVLGRPADDDLLRALAGPAAQSVFDGREGGRTGRWPRVWGARGLLHVWDERATAAIVTALTDDAWRVREMAAKVVGKHQVDDALETVLQLRDDPVPRVRIAADCAVQELTL